MNKNTGGAAFPQDKPHPCSACGFDEGHFESGMTLRDYFAAKAMQGYLANTNKKGVEPIAEFSYRIADAMIAERSK